MSKPTFEDMGYVSGDHVTYIGNKYQYPNGQKGIYKSDHPSDPNLCFVVYSWADDEENFMNYTGVATPKWQLKPGWNETNNKADRTDKDNREDSI